MSNVHDEILAAHAAGSAALAHVTNDEAVQLWVDLTKRGATSLYLSVNEDGHVVDWEIQP